LGGGDAVGHDPFAAGLINRRLVAVRQGHIKAATARGNSGGEAGRPAGES